MGRSTAPRAPCLPPALPGRVALGIARGPKLTMARDKMKSASLNSFHKAHTKPTAAPSPFPTLVHELLGPLGGNPTPDALRPPAAAANAAPNWRTRGDAVVVA